MTPMVFAKGLADSGCWGDKLFGRLVSEELRGGGHGYGLRKASQAKVIYGLEPIFESGRTCIIKVSSLLVFGPSSETSLVGRNYDVTIQVLCPTPHPPSQSLPSSPFSSWVPCGSDLSLSLVLEERLRNSPGCVFGALVFKLCFCSRNLSHCPRMYLHRSLVCGTRGE